MTPDPKLIAAMLPELPVARFSNNLDFSPQYTKEQMRAYGEACITAALAQPGMVLEEVERLREWNRILARLSEESDAKAEAAEAKLAAAEADAARYQLIRDRASWAEAHELWQHIGSAEFDRVVDAFGMRIAAIDVSIRKE